MNTLESYIPQLAAETGLEIKAQADTIDPMADQNEVLDELYYPPELSLYEPKAAENLRLLQDSDAFRAYEQYLAEFTQFMADLNLHFLTPKEFLFLGGNNNAGPCKGLNKLPAKNLWSNIKKLAPVLDELRKRLGHPLQLNSIFRNDAYNRCLDGTAANSFHKKFMAADIKCHDGKNSGHWSSVAKAIRAENVFKGGIGIYNTFVHIDVRGENANWDKRT